jgi:Uma2 family endonuclease
MTSAAPKLDLTYAEYAKLEETSEVKHHYIDGELYAMSGGTPEHSRLAADIIVALASQLRGKPCRAYTSDLRIRVPGKRFGAYPDVPVVCGELEVDADDENSVTNPVVLVEVLSDITEAFDRGAKFAAYRAIPSLKHYVLVSQHEAHLEDYTRNEDGTWTLREARRGGQIVLSAIGCTLEVDALYPDASAAPAP